MVNLAPMKLGKCVLVALPLALGCSKTDDTPRATPDPALSVSGAPGASVSATPPKPKPPPVLTLKQVKDAELESHVQLFMADGAILVTNRFKVGRLTHEGIEWKYEIPKEGYFRGPTILTHAGGRWPEPLWAAYSNDNGRIPAPSFHPLAGKGEGLTFSGGGGMGWVTGAAVVEDTVIVTGYDNIKKRIFQPVMGPVIPRIRTKVKGTCKDEEIPKGFFEGSDYAVHHTQIEATKHGTLIGIGPLCWKRGIVAEVWDKGKTTSRIVPLKEFHGEEGGFSTMRQGPGDVLWFSSDRGVVEYRGGKFALLPKPKKKVEDLFTNVKKELFVNDGDTIYKLDGKGAQRGWRPVAHNDWHRSYGSIVALENENGEGDTFWTAQSSLLYKLEPGSSVKYTDECKTPFVFLYSVKSARKNFSFPTTRKALKSFAGVDQLKLVDFEHGQRRLGVVVPSAETGRKLVEHVKQEMKDEDPKLICFSPPEKAREIDIMKKGI